MSKTYGEQFKEAMCQTREEADKWLQTEIQRYKDEFGEEADKAKNIILCNLGYMAGYYSKKESEHIHNMFGADHPIFGGPNYWDNLTPTKAFEAGQKMMLDRGDGTIAESEHS